MDTKDYSVLDVLINKWNQLHPDLLAKGRSDYDYRQIRFIKNRASIHYEFRLTPKNIIEIRLDNELIEYQDEFLVVSEFINSKSNLVINNHEFINLNNKGEKGKRLFTKVDITESDLAIEIMEELVANTMDNIISMLDKNSWRGIINNPLDDNHTDEEHEQYALQMDYISLKKIAESRSNKCPAISTIETKQYYRDPYIAAYAKKRANGKCQLCGKNAPFLDKNGNPYIESHHIVWLSRGGEDSIENTIGLCPNCHKKMHILDNTDDVRVLMGKVKG